MQCNNLRLPFCERNWPCNFIRCRKNFPSVYIVVWSVKGWYYRAHGRMSEPSNIPTCFLFFFPSSLGDHKWRRNAAYFWSITALNGTRVAWLLKGRTLYRAFLLSLYTARPPSPQDRPGWCNPGSNAIQLFTIRYRIYVMKSWKSFFLLSFHAISQLDLKCGI